MGSWKTCVIAFGLVALNVPGVAFGQTGQPGAEVATFAGLVPQLPAGTTVIVTDMNGRRVKGKLTELTTESLTLFTGSGGQTFARSTVREVQKQIPDTKLDGGLIGFAAGWGVPAAVCAGRSDSSETGAWIAGTLIFGGAPGTCDWHDDRRDPHAQGSGLRGGPSPHRFCDARGRASAN